LIRLVFGFWALMIPFTALAQTFPENTSTRLNDFASLLTAAHAQTVDTMLQQVRSDTGIEMTVVTLESQNSYAPDMTLEQFATALFNAWGVGDAQRNDGIMVLVVRNDRAMRIELGAAFGQAWNAHAKQVIDQEFLPAFRNGRYSDGIRVGTQAVIEDIARPFAAGDFAPVTTGRTENVIVIAVAFLFGALLLGARRLGDAATRMRRCPACGQRGTLRRERHTIMHATQTSTGQGKTETYCTACSFRKVSHYTIAMRRSNQSSGGGGFGGGSSGGGGASGRW